jgi:hypothetical protein
MAEIVPLRVASALRSPAESPHITVFGVFLRFGISMVGLWHLFWSISITSF